MSKSWVHGHSKKIRKDVKAGGTLNFVGKIKIFITLYGRKINENLSNDLYTLFFYLETAIVSRTNHN